ELYFVNDKGIYLEGNVINFRNNRILEEADNQIDLNEFYQSTLSLANQFNGCNDGKKEIEHLQNIINSHIKKHKENNTLPNLNNLDKKTKKLIDDLRTELEEVKREIDNKRNGELAIHSIDDKIIIKKDENGSVSEHEDFKQLRNSENILEIDEDIFDNEYCEIKSSENYRKFQINKNIKKNEKLIKKLMILSVTILSVAIASGTVSLLLLLAPLGGLIFRNWRRIRKYRFRL
ncbi:fam-b protein, partial [Plasmodium berghei]